MYANETENYVLKGRRSNLLKRGREMNRSLGTLERADEEDNNILAGKRDTIISFMRKRGRRENYSVIDLSGDIM